MSTLTMFFTPTLQGQLISTFPQCKQERFPDFQAISIHPVVSRVTWKPFRHVVASKVEKWYNGKLFSQRVANCVRPEMAVIINLKTWTIAN
jgi:hypothetical protein